LARRTNAAYCAASLINTPFLFACLLALLGGVGRCALAHPQTQTERCRAPRFLLIFLPDNFAGTDECSGTLELLQGEQAQGIAHNHCYALLTRATGDCAL